MTQTELHHAISRATGDDSATIAARGFSLVDEDAPLADDDLEALIVDWDSLQAERNTAVLAPRGAVAAA
jgi:hypothetical protein